MEMPPSSEHGDYGADLKKNCTNLIVPSSYVGVVGDVFHVNLRMWDARGARLRRCIGV